MRSRQRQRFERPADLDVSRVDVVLLLALVATLASAESRVEIAEFGKKLDFLSRFAPFQSSTPSHDQLGDLFATLDSEQFQACFIAGTSALAGVSDDIIAIDGKTLRRSDQHGGAQAPIHMISA